MSSFIEPRHTLTKLSFRVHPCFGTRREAAHEQLVRLYHAVALGEQGYYFSLPVWSTVGARGLEPPTPRSQTVCSNRTELRPEARQITLAVCANIEQAVCSIPPFAKVGRQIPDRHSCRRQYESAMRAGVLKHGCCEFCGNRKPIVTTRTIASPKSVGYVENTT